jgi:eukaryotic-like serine/threonine-protein kinase
MTGPLVLPDDIEIVPVTALSAAVRAQIGGADDDYAVTRPRSRVPSKVIDAQAAAWLRQFKEPTTLVQAILRHSKALERKPQEVLEDIYPFLESCLHARLLVEPGVASQIIQPSFAPGAEVAGHRIEECIHVLADTELYRVTHNDRQAALKISRPEAGSGIKCNLAREASIQKRLNGHVAPRLFTLGETGDGRAYVISEWIVGELCTERAAVLRIGARDPLSPALLSLCGNILDAYATLHSLGVTHGDVHSGNILVERDGEVRIIDYGLSSMECNDEAFAMIPRGGVGFFLDPEYAGASLAHSMLPTATLAGDQYSIAALLYLLASGRQYLDFSLEKELLLRQILEESPVPLAARGVPGTAALDRVLLRALSKEPSDRFPDVASMAAAYWQNVVGLASPGRSEKKSSRPRSASSQETRKREAWMNSFLDSLADPDTSSHGTGFAGSAYRLFRLACIREDAHVLSLAERYLDRAESNLVSAGADRFSANEKRVPWCESQLGLAWLRALMAHSCWDFDRRSWATQQFVRLCNSMLERRTVSVDPSALLASSLLLDAFRWDRTSDLNSLVDVGNKLLDRIWAEFDGLPPLAAPGDEASSASSANCAECLYATLQWSRATRTLAPANLSIRLDQLADRATGRHMAVCAAPEGQLRSPFWHTGSAAFVFLWTLAFRVLRDPRWLRLAEAAARDSAGPGPEGYSLDHLVAKGYSQLNLYKHTGDRCWLDNAYAAGNAAVRLAEHAHPPPGPGASTRIKKCLGLAVLINDLAHPRCSAMPFLEEECWPAPAA